MISAPKKRVQSSPIRFVVQPRDVPLEKIARLLHLTPGQFERLLPQLEERDFPRPDPTTGMYDLNAVNIWMDERHVKLYGQHRELAPTFAEHLARKQRD